MFSSPFARQIRPATALSLLICALSMSACVELEDHEPTTRDDAQQDKQKKPVRWPIDQPGETKEGGVDTPPMFERVQRIDAEPYTSPRLIRTGSSYAPGLVDDEDVLVYTPYYQAGAPIFTQDYLLLTDANEVVFDFDASNINVWFEDVFAHCLRSNHALHMIQDDSETWTSGVLSVESDTRATFNRREPGEYDLTINARIGDASYEPEYISSRRRGNMESGALCEALLNPARAKDLTFRHHYAMVNRRPARVAFKTPERCDQDAPLLLIQGAGAAVLDYDLLDEPGNVLNRAVNWNGTRDFTINYPADTTHEFEVSQSTRRLMISPDAEFIGSGELWSEWGDRLQVQSVSAQQIDEVEFSFYDNLTAERIADPSAVRHEDRRHSRGGAVAWHLGIESITLKDGRRACNLLPEVEVNILTPDTCSTDDGIARRASHPHELPHRVWFQQDGVCEIEVSVQALEIVKRFEVQVDLQE